jgi:hypothetical protein
MKQIFKVLCIFLFILNVINISIGNLFITTIVINLIFLYLWFKPYATVRSNEQLNELISSQKNTSNNYIDKIETAYNNNLISLEEIDNLRQEFSKSKV